MKYLFGPVPSRRLGISLGVDLIPHKYCSLDCVYCEIGKTNHLTIERESYLNADEIIAELDSYLCKNPELDYITFSGQGEPTLNSDIGKVITFLKTEYPQYKIALISNGTLFFDETVLKEVIKADLILPSLDAALQSTFEKINRPEKSLEIDRIISGLVELRKQFKGKFYLEIFIIQGINDSHEDLEAMRKAIEMIKPEIIQLNSLDRPGTEDWVKKVTLEKMEEIAKFFEPFKTEIIAKFNSKKSIKSFDFDIRNQILTTIKRRPCTDEDLKKMLNIHINELNKYISELLQEGLIVSVQQERGTFFKIKDD